MASEKKVIPMLVYQELEAAHDFLVKAFGFESAGLERDGDGRAFHAELRHGTASIWLHRVTAEWELQSAREQPMASSGLVVHVPDVDAHFSRASAAGARIDDPPRDQPYGQREYGARDPEGHRWWFATPLARAARG